MPPQPLDRIQETLANVMEYAIATGSMDRTTGKLGITSGRECCERAAREIEKVFDRVRGNRPPDTPLLVADIFEATLRRALQIVSETP